MNSSKLHDLVDEMDAAGMLEDRREYSPEDLQKAYRLTGEEAEDLHWLVQQQFELQKPTLPELGNIPAATVKSFLEEAVHSNFDGWDNEHDRVVLERFVADLQQWAKQSGEGSS
jgi:hypothetical protein